MITKKLFIPLLLLCFFLVNCGKKCDNPSSHNYDQREGCETCTDDQLNGDENKIDCGGSLCQVPCISVINWNTSNSTIPDNTINDISETDDGDIWLATGFGISKFNGTTFTNWNSSNSTIQSNSVYAIQGYGNKVYVGTINDGLSLFDGTNWISFSSNTNVSYSIQCMAKNNNSVYVGTTFRGISMFEDSTYIGTFNEDNSDIPSNNVKDIAFDSNNNMWIATSIGVAKFDGTTWTTFNSSNSSLLDNYVSNIEIDQNDAPWVTTSNGVQRFDGNSWITESSTLTNAFGFGYFSEDQTMWFFNGLTYRYYNDSFFNYQEDDITGLCTMTKNSNLWVGALNEGLYQIKYQ